MAVRMLGLITTIMFVSLSTKAQLSGHEFYANSCPLVFERVKWKVEMAMWKEARMGASILRLFFHDCFVNGCDASILLDDTPSMTGEKTAPPNLNSARGFEVIDDIKTAVEMECPGVVSCADLLVIAARDSVAMLGGPRWDVKLGRRDAKSASRDAATTSLPSPASNLTGLISAFTNLGLSIRDMVALSGSHTVGLAHCTTFKSRVYNESDIDESLARSLKKICPLAPGVGDSNLTPLDLNTPTLFDESYFTNLVEKKGLLHSDQQLFNGGSTESMVRTYSTNRTAFYDDFASAMIKMGDIKPLIGPSNGEIRKNCRKVNS